VTDEPAHISEALAGTLDRIAEKYEEAEVVDTPTDLETVDEAFALHRSEAWMRLVPARFRNARVDDFDDAARGDLEAWAEKPDRNLLLVGPVGTGKTHAAFAVIRRVFHKTRVAAEFWPMVDLLDALRPGGDSGTDPQGRGVLERVRDAHLLILDDIGSERPTDWTAERAYSVLNRRWMDERPTVMTSNLTPSARGAGDREKEAVGPTLEDALGARLFSRVIGSDALVLQLGGGDKRRSQPGD
jgi:DNA replication protein DnaC